MVAKHTIFYFLGKGLPGIINFLALSIYTRLLLPSEYGKYSILIATISLFTTVFFQWIRLTLLRFLPKCVDDNERNELMSSVSVGFLISIVISAFITVGYYFFFKNQFSMQLILLGLLLLWIQAVLEVFLEFLRSNLEVKKYSIINFIKSLLSILIGSFLAYLGWGAMGLIVGICFSILAVLLFFYRDFIKMLPKSLKFFNKKEFIVHLRYGLPLTISFAMAYIFNVSDRFFISYYIGDSATGIYSVGYDLSKQTLWVIMMSINLASYPLIVRALEKNDVIEAKKQLTLSLNILLGVAMPAAIGLAILSKSISSLMLGKEFTAEVSIIIPYISIGALIAGLKSYYIDLSFQLGKKTYLQIYSVTISAIVNIILNFVLIPAYGLMGAIFSSLICYVIDFVVSYYISRKCFKLPFAIIDLMKIISASLIMGMALYFSNFIFSGILGLLCQIIFGIFIYVSILLLLKLIKIPSKLTFS